MKLTLLAFAAAGFCCWQARDLFNAWLHAPFDRLDPLAFAVWSLPLAYTWVRRGAGRVNPTLLLASAVGTMLGSMLDLNMLQNLAFAGALGSFVVGCGGRLPWLLAAPCWMPAFGWVVSGWGFTAVAVTRLIVAGAAAAWGIRLIARSGGPHAA